MIWCARALFATPYELPIVNNWPAEPIVLVLSRAATVLVLVIEREQRYWKMKSSIIIDLTFSARGSLTRRTVLGHRASIVLLATNGGEPLNR